MALNEVNSVNENHTLPCILASFHLEALPHKNEREVKMLPVKISELGNGCPAFFRLQFTSIVVKTRNSNYSCLVSYLL